MIETSQVGIGHAYAKAILLGEHTVVHGTPAIAFPLPALPVRAVARRGTSGYVPDGHLRFVAGQTDTGTRSGPHVAVDAALSRWGVAAGPVEVTVECEIPLARGLGSSAACAGAAVRAVADLFDHELDLAALYEFVQCGEQVAHGRASGIDASAVLAAGPIWFESGSSRPLAVGLDASIVIADTGAAGSTAHAVAGVRAKLAADQLAANRLLCEAADLIAAGAHELAGSTAGHAVALGKTMVAFQELLAELGVSTPGIDTLVSAALDAGALGAKLTGAGLGGCVIALTWPAEADAVSAALRHAGAVRTWTVSTDSLRAAPPSLSDTRPERDRKL
ncbi:mevalonate kinase [Nocardia camponoti]|uniref:mevalonate kinase n=1 Tax=Nocardia camponoti TaxID=1616106 RepID=A0A917V7D1_9NOCA|nr:mevalonate kinase [Nocardia camponoti]GGK47253.1 mevalonate kinase [Nocardia camponoti]